MSQVALESDDTVQSGVTVTITNLGYLSLGILEVETPGIAENNTATYGLTIVDDCDGGTVEDGSTPAHDTFFVDEYGQQDWMITLNCGSTSNGSNSQNKKGTQETWTWDLHFVADDTPNPGTAGSKASAKTTAVGALDDPQLGVAIPVTGTIQCGFAYFDTATNTVPDDQPGAGSTFQTQDSFQYAASLVYSATGGFQAVVEAGEWQTNRIATLETEICTESNDASEITSTNVVPITRLETLAARLTNTVQATVSATVTNDQYHVHVEIPSAQGGHSTKLLSVNRLPACAAIPTNTEDAVASDDWGTGTRVLDFHGTLDPADPATLSGQIQMDHGWITWNLKTSVSPSLFLHVQSVTGGTFRVWWNAGANVRLQRSDLLTNPAWQDVPDTLGSSNTMLSPAEQSLFFRLMMNP